jgi:hypothetical protein
MHAHSNNDFRHNGLLSKGLALNGHHQDQLWFHKPFLKFMCPKIDRNRFSGFGMFYKTRFCMSMDKITEEDIMAFFFFCWILLVSLCFRSSTFFVSYRFVLSIGEY